MDHDQAGILISLFALTALIIRPLVSPIFNAANAKGWLALGLVGVMLSLCLYYPARSFWTLALVRLAHGGFHVVMASATMARIVSCIPPSRSSRAFGLVSVIILLPYAVMPLAVDLLMTLLGGFPQVLMALSLTMLPALALLSLVIAGRADPGPAAPVLARREAKPGRPADHVDAGGIPAALHRLWPGLLFPLQLRAQDRHTQPRPVLHPVHLHRDRGARGRRPPAGPLAQGPGDWPVRSACWPWAISSCPRPPAR